MAEMWLAHVADKIDLYSFAKCMYVFFWQAVFLRPTLWLKQVFSTEPCGMKRKKKKSEYWKRISV